MAPLHSGFLAEYPLIRVDNFTASLPALPTWLDDEARQDLPVGATHFRYPHISLLSHPHTDHLAGLSSVSQLSAPIYCSEVTKALLLAMERKEDRIRFDTGKCTSRKRPYKHLRRNQDESRAWKQQLGVHASKGAGHACDRLVTVPMDAPLFVEYNARFKVRITLLPANHMPGSTIFLIEGPRGSVLHTGDVRAEPHFLQQLMTRTHLGRLSVPYSPALTMSPPSPAIAQFSTVHSAPSGVASEAIPSTSLHSTRLEAVYLDTERIMDSAEPPLRSMAIMDVLQLIKLIPASTSIHIDCWTSGYEHMLIAIRKTFGAEHGKIHLDRYKAELFQHMALDAADFGDLKDVGCVDKSMCGRFCACDAEECKQSASLHLQAQESMSIETWKVQRRKLQLAIKQARKGCGAFPTTIALPIQRHSPLPELYRMLALWRPRYVVANTGAMHARFLSARISEHIGLDGASDEEARQRGAQQSEEWSRMCDVWAATASTTEQDAVICKEARAQAFFDHVARFRLALWGQKKAESERIQMERLDAAPDAEFMAEALPPASISLLRPTPADSGPAAPTTPPRHHNGPSPVVRPWDAAGKYAAVDASPFMTAAMRKDGCVSSSPAAKRARTGTDPSPSDGQPRLTVHLASLYVAYASMYLGWRIRNPSRYRGDVAWRAIRKLKPALARQTEEALLKELGWAIPPWEKSASMVQNTEACDNASQSVAANPQAAPPPRPSSSSPCQRNLQDSISPFRLGHDSAPAVALAQELYSEAVSQQGNFSQRLQADGDAELITEQESANEQLQLVAVDVTGKAAALDEPPVISTEKFAEAVECIRSTKRPSSSAMQGPSLFASILSEWVGKAPQSSRKQSVRLQHQLNLVGVAARSQRARRLLAWEDVDLGRAEQALHALIQRIMSEDAGRKHRDRIAVVQRFLQRSHSVASCAENADQANACQAKRPLEPRENAQ